ncbi:MAG: methionine biosynthesis protein MetW [Puniceicoccales bacterium]|jgi:methionine biosynthesis protein MetW|nr:methionine biosynthesis protein MetW [Puniceicoccales bacterium]
MSLQRTFIKRDTDIPVFMRWIQEGANVLDLGCGRGEMLFRLAAEKKVQGIGVEKNPDKVAICLDKGVRVIQGDILDLLKQIPDASFDWVVCSRILQELEQPGEIILQSLRVGKYMAIAFVNNGHWRNRLSMLRYGNRVRNSIYPNPWYQSSPSNPVSISDFEGFCIHYGITIKERVYLGGDWRTPRSLMPKLLAGYGIYVLTRHRE